MTLACWKNSTELREAKWSAHSRSVARKLKSTARALATGSFAGAAGQQGASRRRMVGDSMTVVVVVAVVVVVVGLLSTAAAVVAVIWCLRPCARAGAASGEPPFSSSLLGHCIHVLSP